MSLPVQVGVADPENTAVPVIADPSAYPFTSALISIVLTLDFAQECPPGWPSPPFQTGAAQGQGWYPRTFSAGTSMKHFACVAHALIAAGAATAN